MEVTRKITDAGAEQWMLNGRLHRLDGPAVVYGDGSFCYFWINGRCLPFHLFCEKANLSPEDILYMKLKYKIRH